MPFSVIPAKAGIQSFHSVAKASAPFFNGATPSCEAVNWHCLSHLVRFLTVRTVRFSQSFSAQIKPLLFSMSF